MLERFEDAPLLFCSFDSDADLGGPDKLEGSPAVMFELLSQLYAAFDDLTEQSELVKVEHVGGDYLVVAPEVGT